MLKQWKELKARLATSIVYRRDRSAAETTCTECGRAADGEAPTLVCPSCEYQMSGYNEQFLARRAVEDGEWSASCDGCDRETFIFEGQSVCARCGRLRMIVNDQLMSRFGELEGQPPRAGHQIGKTPPIKVEAVCPSCRRRSWIYKNVLDQKQGAVVCEVCSSPFRIPASGSTEDEKIAVRIEFGGIMLDVIRRSTGIRLSDEHLALATILCDEAEGRRSVGETARYIKAIGESLVNNQGRSLAAALPSFLYTLDGQGVHVMTTDDFSARNDAELYRNFVDFLGDRFRVGLIHTGQSLEDRRAAYKAAITIGPVEQFEADKASGGTAIIRVAKDREEFFPRYRQVVCLPNPT
ncbi:MAG: hypothetical protein ACRDRS_17515 [Pseudonocardiaceae bacterium]